MVYALMRMIDRVNYFRECREWTRRGYVSSRFPQMDESENCELRGECEKRHNDDDEDQGNVYPFW